VRGLFEYTEFLLYGSGHTDFLITLYLAL